MPHQIHKDARLRMDGKKLQGDQLVHDDVVASIVIHLHANGDMSVAGNVGDANLALQMIDHAGQTLKGHLTPERGVIIPARDVVVHQNPQFPTIPAGDMK